MILPDIRTGNFWYIDLMRLLFVADGRSPIARNWISYFVERGDEVYLASTFPCPPDPALKGFVVTPVAFSGGSATASRPARRSLLSPGSRLRMRIRHVLGPLTIGRASRSLRLFIQRTQPDLVHAMRIPFEGMLAADAYGSAPLLVSVWGNDFTLHAPSTPLMRHYTSWTMQVASAIHADCRRDLRLSKQWGFDPSKPSLVAPGNGGVRLDVFYPSALPVGEPTVLNPRGPRAYVRNDVFFQAIPLVLSKVPRARFLCASMDGDRQARDWVRRLNIAGSVELLPSVPQADMADLYRRAQVMVSPAVHDGTPNSLLEAMASGCFPVVGDLESIREWIKDDQNGLLVDPGDPQALAHAILAALDNEDLRRRAAGLNHELIASRADYTRCMAEASGFYHRLISTN